MIDRIQYDVGVDPAVKVPDITAWELNVKPPAELEKQWRTGAPKKLKTLTEVTVVGHYDCAPVPEYVTITWPDGTTTETTWERLMEAGVYVTLDGMQEGEVPTQQITITCTEEPEADAPTVVEGQP